MGITCEGCKGNICDNVKYYEETLDQRFRRSATKSGLEEQDDMRVQKRKTLEKHWKTSENVRLHNTSPRYEKQGNE